MSQNIANPSPEKVVARTLECLRRLMETGLTYEDLQSPIDDPQMRARLVNFWRSGGYEPTTDEKMARSIGITMFGVQEAIQHFGVKPTKSQLAMLSVIPFSEQKLREVKDTHILVAVLPLSILDIKGKVDCSLFWSKEDAWYHSEKFAKDKGQAGWHLVRKTIVPNSTSKNWNEQQALLTDNEETPIARIMVYTIIGHYLNTGERLFENIYARCSNLDSDGSRVNVGSFDSGGLTVYSFRDDDRFDNIGVSSSRKFN
ncbi:hypothetical protein KJ751_03670 [Patescibacteria group bacterium]|nr:hypothetical protein [Patescibacteria group bacterium]